MPNVIDLFKNKFRDMIFYDRHDDVIVQLSQMYSIVFELSFCRVLVILL